MIIMELVNGIPSPTGGPVTSFDRYKVSAHLSVQPDECGVINYQGSPVWCRDVEAKVIGDWYSGKEHDIKKPRYPADMHYDIEKFFINKNVPVSALCIASVATAIYSNIDEFINVLTQDI